VDRLAGAVSAADPTLAPWAVLESSRQLVERERARISAGKPGTLQGPEAWTAAVSDQARSLAVIRPRRVVNATGVVLHTNLGRAPIAEGAARAATVAATGYSDLELDLDTGRRGQRLAGLATKLSLLSRAPAGMAVNNNAAALMLVLDTLARGREVVISRGELVEIGGSFRVPDIMERSGARLVEVGTTNRTHPRDYEQAIGPDTALLLKVHRSNFEQTGFVKEVSLAELVRIGRAHGIPVAEDLGSGTLIDLRSHGLPEESYVPARYATGADVVCFSGDKLLGGPQAGLVIGNADVVEEMRSNPLARALRLDKMTLAALDWTLGCMLDGRGRSELPVLRQLLEPASALEERARVWEKRLSEVAPRLRVAVEPDRVPVGGGSLPGFELDTWVLALRGEGKASALAARLRGAADPVVARIRDDSVLLDLRTLAEADLECVAVALDGAC